MRRSAHMGFLTIGKCLQTIILIASQLSFDGSPKACRPCYLLIGYRHLTVMGGLRLHRIWMVFSDRGLVVNLSSRALFLCFARQ